MKNVHNTKNYIGLCEIRFLILNVLFIHLRLMQYFTKFKILYIKMI
jgi:hypothetical protein